MTQPDMTPAPKRRWTRWVLIGSLAMNVLVIGVVIGTVWRQPVRMPPTLSGNEGMSALVRAMPQATRDTLRDTARARRDQSAALRNQSRQLRRELIEALQAEPFAMTAVHSLFDRQGAIVRELTDRGHVLVLETIETMSTEERHNFAKRLAEMGRKRR